MKNVFKLLPILFISLFLASCVSSSKTMREPNARVEFVKGDFDFSEQVVGEATSVKVLGIDWRRLFRGKSASVGDEPTTILSSIPIIGNLGDKTSNYALYDMMEKEPGYDVVFYPKYEKVVKNPFLWFVVITNVKATARLAKIKK
tara:strand:+ start:999 stop:1433 length:435 start_codon:yes stop_codon:yes gene_type:complete